MNLHPSTEKLVDDFAAALKGKLVRAEQKYGYSDNWRTDDWEADCQRDLARHVQKGDPLDVAAYAAFCWARGYRTAPKPQDAMAAFEAAYPACDMTKHRGGAIVGGRVRYADPDVDKMFGAWLAAPKVASEGAGLREALIRVARMIPGVLCADSVSDDFLAHIPDELAHYTLTLSTDATDGATGGGEVTGEALFRAFMVGDVSRLTTTALPEEWPHMQPSYRKAWNDLAATFTTTGADLLEQAARVADNEAADIRKFWHMSSDPWQAGRLATAETIAAAIRALSARNLTEGGEK